MKTLSNAQDAKQFTAPSWPIGGLFHRLGLALVFILVATSTPLFIAIALALVEIGLVIELFLLARTPLMVSAILLGMLITSISAVWLSQLFATTPPITNAQGQPLPNSIAVLEQVNLNGSQQADGRLQRNRSVATMSTRRRR